MSNADTPIVSFVSSGPGDPELMTLKAVRRMQEAEVILFDDLSATPALVHANPAAELVSVGKRGGRPSPKQEYISRLLVDYSQTRQKVVRLKSGDCTIFGRLEEELTAVRNAGLRYEIIPGVTSATAAAAAIGIPLTRRLIARRVQFLTGHDVTGTLPKDLNLAALADPTATTVVFMGKRTLDRLTALLIEAGLPVSTPAVLAENVSLPEQIVLHGTLETIARLADERAGDGPAIILFGPLAEGA